MSIENRINSIQEAFQIGKLEGETHGIQPIFNFEKTVEKELISVAMEGCSMGIALTSLKTNQSLANWNVFVQEKGINYLSQIHVGLGWALAELQLPVQFYIADIDPKWQLRVLDGFGYYCGLFRRREAIRTMSYPTEIPKELYAGFNQGIGRFLFYLAQGDVERLVRNIELFPDDRHADFWRGIGIAATFIGGLDKIAIEEMIKSAGEHEKQLLIGVVLATNSLKKANSHSEASKRVSDAFFDGKLDFSEHVLESEKKHYASVNELLERLSK